MCKSAHGSCHVCVCKNPVCLCTAPLAGGTLQEAYEHSQFNIFAHGSMNFSLWVAVRAAKPGLVFVCLCLYMWVWAHKVLSACVYIFALTWKFVCWMGAGGCKCALVYHLCCCVCIGFPSTLARPQGTLSGFSPAFFSGLCLPY